MTALELFQRCRVSVHCYKEHLMNEDHWVKELLDEAHQHGREDRLARFDAHLLCLLFELDQLPGDSTAAAPLSGWRSQNAGNA